MKTIGYHACSREGGPIAVQQKAPFKSFNKIGGFQYLGSGYYFWDTFIVNARHWGKTHYKGSYYILEYAISVSDDKVMDLVGDLKKFDEFNARVDELSRSMTDEIRKKYEINGKISTGAWIELFRIMNSRKHGYFDYDLIRAQQTRKVNKNPLTGFEFDKKGNWILLKTPKVIICISDNKPGYWAFKNLIDE